MSESEQEQKSVPVATQSQNNSFGTPVAIIVAGIIVAAAIIFSGGGKNTPTPTAGTGGQVAPPTGPSQEEQLRLAAMQPDDHVRGNRDADVYILEFSDTECPFCKRFHETMLQVMNEYGDRVAWVYRHFPLASLHPTAAREAEATECANDMGGSDVFWAYVDTIYERTPQGAALTDEDLFSFAVELGLNREAFVECVNSGKYAEEVQKDLENAVALGGTGTPHSMIVTKDSVTLIRGAQPFNVVKSSLDAILAEQE